MRHALVSINEDLRYTISGLDWECNQEHPDVGTKAVNCTGNTAII